MDRFHRQAALVKAWGAGSVPKEVLKASELALNVASQGGIIAIELCCDMLGYD